jgi:predicted  nucleic acid-binding Zn-ribbon protein
MTDAEQARVAEHALAELQEARTKLSAARTAVKNEDMLLAKRMAQQASVDIQLASAKAELAKAEAVNDDLTKNIDVLKQEMDRNTGAQQ